MTIKIRFHGDKAVIRWKTPVEQAFLKRQMTMFRDFTPGIPISLKDEKGREIPRLPKPMMMPMPVSGQPQTTISGTPQTGAVIIPSTTPPPVKTEESMVVKIENKPEEK